MCKRNFLVRGVIIELHDTTHLGTQLSACGYYISYLQQLNQQNMSKITFETIDVHF
jgi:hypothetical protein